MEGLLQVSGSGTVLFLGAVGSYVIGLLCRDQLYIRLLVVLGSMFYAVYYWTVPAEPLWDAILGTALIAAASLQGAIQIVWSRSSISAPPESRETMEKLGHIEPGLFRRLLKTGKPLTASQEVSLTVEGARPDSLWLLLEGEIVLERRGHRPYNLLGPCFVGEIAWLNRSVASATTTARPGALLLRLPHDTLRRSLRRNHRLALALDALIAQDLARKLAKSAPLVPEALS